MRVLVVALCCLLILPPALPSHSELTFQLADNGLQCFFEEIQKDVSFHIVYQVITGGHYDVDCYIEDPTGKVLYKQAKKHYDVHVQQAEATGVHKFCFSNEFSSFTHKRVHFNLHVGNEPPLLAVMGERITALTQMESTCVSIHEAMNSIIGSQSSQRLQEASDRLHSDDLNHHVIYWSVGEALVLFVVSLGQVVLLKSFFTEKRALPGAVTT
eukprot:gi/632979537/ref/XP_007906526.1/ PREDICTED: transmembrane emp24 domain-containing protein 3-like [Callorhinchus milii]